MSADPAAFAADDAALNVALEAVVSAKPPTQGAFCFASSAGGVYAGCTTRPANERTEVAPLGEYGYAKLRQEAAVAEAVSGRGGVRAVNVRISNLYGPGQHTEKRQGLISHLVVNTLQRVPTTIYVPLDTSRDYLHTRGAARMMARCGRDALSDRPGESRVRIIASERNHSIVQLIGAVSRLLKRRVPFVVAETPQTRLQPLLLSFRSVHRDMHRLDTVTLEEGLASIIADLRRRRAVR